MKFKFQQYYTCSLSWEKKISVAKNNVLEEEDKIETVKKNFEGWQVSAVEEVARMKLKGRIENIDKSDFKNASVIDIGCNTGQMCRYACDCGADYVLGVDYDKSAITKARDYSKKYNITFLTDDLDNFIFYTNLPDFDVSTPPRIFRRVDLPEPLGPITPTNSPGSISIEIVCRTFS